MYKRIGALWLNTPIVEFSEKLLLNFYLLWQVKQSALAAFDFTSKCEMFALLCTSWQDAHSILPANNKSELIVPLPIPDAEVIALRSPSAVTKAAS